MRTCSLCGEEIDRKDLTDEHVPPKQFYPKAVRETVKAPLWTVPSHRACNEKYKLDEEYLYHYMLGMVVKSNPTMGNVLMDDLRRRARKPQTRGLIRRLVSECSTVTSGGIHLPNGHVQISYEVFRIQNVIVKIAQCLYFMDHEKFLPRSWCKHCELCETPDELQPLFDHLKYVKPKHVAKEIFSYRHLLLAGTHLYFMLFWEGFAFCLSFDDPALVTKGVLESTPE